MCVCVCAHVCLCVCVCAYVGVGLVKSASSYAMFGHINVRNKGLHIPKKIDPNKIKVRMEHFDLALREVWCVMCDVWCVICAVWCMMCVCVMFVVVICCYYVLYCKWVYCCSEFVCKMCMCVCIYVCLCKIIPAFGIAEGVLSLLCTWSINALTELYSYLIHCTIITNG